MATWHRPAWVGSELLGMSLPLPEPSMAPTVHRGQQGLSQSTGLEPADLGRLPAVGTWAGAYLLRARFLPWKVEKACSILQVCPERREFLGCGACSANTWKVPGKPGPAGHLRVVMRLKRVNAWKGLSTVLGEERGRLPRVHCPSQFCWQVRRRLHSHRSPSWDFTTSPWACLVSYLKDEKTEVREKRQRVWGLAGWTRDQLSVRD